MHSRRTSVPTGCARSRRLRTARVVVRRRSISSRSKAAISSPPRGPRAVAETFRNATGCRSKDLRPAWRGSAGTGDGTDLSRRRRGPTGFLVEIPLLLELPFLIGEIPDLGFLWIRHQDRAAILFGPQPPHLPLG